MPDRDTTSWGSGVGAGAGRPAANSAEIAGVPENSTLAVTNRTNGRSWTTFHPHLGGSGGVRRAPLPAPASCVAPELVWVPWLAMEPEGDPEDPYVWP